MSSFSVASSSPRETARIAAVLSARLRGGDVVLLTGDLASGKTTFVKAVASTLGSNDVVTSPTFTLAQFYATPRAPLLHIDTYRLAGLAEYRDLGLDEHYETAITLVEWGDLVTDEFPCRLSVRFERPGRHDDAPTPDEDVRQLTFSSMGERWSTALGGLRAELLEQHP